MGVTPDPPRPVRFVVICGTREESASDLDTLTNVLARQPVGEAVQIVDLLLNGATTVHVAANGSVWEYFGSRHAFHVEDRYDDVT